jgi:predicted RNA-binding Zn ribbon-like protein
VRVTLVVADPASHGYLPLLSLPSGSVVAGEAAAAPAVALAARPAVRVGCCPGRDCGWVFVNRGNRRWCIMATCGNRAKAAGTPLGTTADDAARHVRGGG